MLFESKKETGAQSIADSLVLYGRKVNYFYASDFVEADRDKNELTTQYNYYDMSNHCLFYRNPSGSSYIKRVCLSTNLVIVTDDYSTHDVKTRIGTITFQVTNSSSKYGLNVIINGTTTALYSATASIIKYFVEVIKLNPKLYLILYSRTINKSTYTQHDTVYARFLYLNASNALAISGATNFGMTDATTATVSSERTLGILSANNDNTQLFITRMFRTITDSTGAVTASSASYNNYRYRGTTTMGLRSTAWTSIFNNKAYYGMACLFQGIGFNTNYFNEAGTVDTRASYPTINGDWYGTPVNDYATWGYLGNSPRANVLSTRGVVDNFYVLVSSISKTNNILTIYYYVFTYDCITRKRQNQVGSSSTFTLSQSYLDGYTSTSFDNLYLKFARIVDGTLLIGFGTNNTKDNAGGTIENPIIYVVGLSITVTDSLNVIFKYSGTCYGSTFRTDRLKDNMANHSTSASFVSCLQEWFDERYTQYDYDYFRQYAIEYKT